MKSQTITRFVSEDLEELLEREFQHIKSDRFVLSMSYARADETPSFEAALESLGRLALLMASHWAHA